MAERLPTNSWLELDGRRVFYRALPPGRAAAGSPPLLLIHGISCCTETWEPFLGALAARDDAPAVIVPDLPAHGRSTRPAGLLGMAAPAARTGRLRRPAGARRP